MNIHSRNLFPDGVAPGPSLAGTLGRSLVGIVLIAGAVWVGAAILGARGGSDRPVAAAGIAADIGAGTPFIPDSAAAHRRQVFEERRLRYEAQRSGDAAIRARREADALMAMVRPMEIETPAP